MVGGRFLLLFCTIEQNKSRRVDIDPLALGDGLLYSPEPKTSGVQRVRTLWQDKRSNVSLRSGGRIACNSTVSCYRADKILGALSDFYSSVL